MFKFLRKYNKFILAVGGVLLMITFLIPQAIQNLSERAGQRGASFATVANGEEVSALTLNNLQRELQILQRMGARIPGIGEITRPEHWYLLTREADQAGLIATGQSVQIDDATLASLFSGERDFNFVRQTIAKLNGVQLLINLYQTGGMYSDRRLKSFAARTLHTVGTNMVVLEADHDQSPVSPTDEEITKTFEANKDKFPGEGEHGFGYKLPNRAKLEWLKISEPAVREMMRQSDQFDRVAQRYHWAANPDKIFAPVDNAAEVPEEVKSNLLDRITGKKMEEISKFATDQLRLSRRGLEEVDGYAVLPADWAQKALKLQDLATQLQAKFGIALPAYEATGDRWLTGEDMSKLPGIGEASTTKFGDRGLFLAQLVLSAKEFDGNASLQMQKGIAGPPLKDFEGNLFVFRITDTDPSRTPTSVDEVREQVVKDVRRLDHFQALLKQAPDLEQQAVAEGLLAVAMSHNTIVQVPSQVYLDNQFRLQMQVQNNQPIELIPSDLPVIGSNKAAVAAIVDYARAQPADKPVKEWTEEQRVLTVPVEDRLALLVVRINDQQPLTEETFNTLIRIGAIQTLLLKDEQGATETIADVFGFDAIAKRNSFKLNREVESEDGEVPAPAPAPSA